MAVLLAVLVSCTFFFLIGIHSMQSWTATMRDRVTNKKKYKTLNHAGNQLRKGLQMKGVC